MKVYFIRHGQSTRNVENRISGWEQVPLTQAGEQDALRAGKILKDIVFDKVYSSDLLRARQTCALALPDAVAEESMLLREISVGTMAGVKLTEAGDLLGQKGLDAIRNRDYRPFDGENTAMQMDRVRKFLEMLDQKPWERVAVFCHHGVVDCMLQIATDARWRCGACDNGSVSVFEKTNGQWRLIKWNYSDILE